MPLKGATPAPTTGTIGKVKPPAPKLSPDEMIAEIKGRSRAHDPKKKKTNFLVFGDSGSGKTRSLSTAIAPLFVDSFDPDGASVLQDRVDAGLALVDDQWEMPSRNLADDFLRYQRVFFERQKAEFFNKFATYSVDSLTLLCTYIFAWAEQQVALIPTKSGEVDTRATYGVAQKALMDILRRILALPCDVIITCHPSKLESHDSGTIKEVTPKFIGRVRSEPMALISEIYHLEVVKCREADLAKKLKVGDPIRHFLTGSDGIVRAKSRLNYLGKIPLRCPVDFKAIRKMAGLPFEDKVL